MLSVYWGFLIFGVLFAAITLIFGDLVSHVMENWPDFLSGNGLLVFHPLLIVGGITLLGGSGIILTEYTPLSSLLVFLMALLLMLFVNLPLYYLYVKPMRNSENSIGFSLQDLVGKIGEVIITVPAAGFGEVLVKVGAGNSSQIAASFEQETIQSGTRVVVVEVRESALYVTKLDESEGESL